MRLAVTATGGGVFSLSRTMVDLSTVLLGDAKRLFLTILAIVGDFISVLESTSLTLASFSLSPLALMVGISLSLAASSSSFSVGVPMNTRSSSPSSRSLTGVWNASSDSFLYHINKSKIRNRYLNHITGQRGWKWPWVYLKNQYLKFQFE